MKTVMKFFSLLLCFELVMGPVQGSLFMSNDAVAADCPAGQTFNSSVNRCLTSYEVLQVNEATNSCGSDMKCYRDNAVAALSRSNPDSVNGAGTKKYNADELFNEDGEYQNGKAKTGVSIMNGAAIAIPLVIVISVLLEKLKSRSGKSFKCNPTSLLLMYGAAAALGAGELYGYFNHKSKLQDIKEEWDKTVVPKSDSETDQKRVEATEAQSQAFEFLAQNEDQVAKTAKTKRGFYYAASGLFAAGAVAATVELFQLNAATSALKAATTAAEATALQQKISKLSCNTEEENADKAESLEKEEKELAEKKAKEESEIAERDQRMKDFADEENKRYGGMTEEECNASQDCLAYKNKKDEEWNKKVEQNKIDKADKEGKSSSAPKSNGCSDGLVANIYTGKCGPASDANKKPSSLYFDQNSCETAGYTFHAGVCVGYQSKENNLKKVAAYNVSTAKDAEQLAQLMNEFNAIEFENYSKLSYLDQNETKELRQLTLPSSLSQMIASTLIPEAHADGGDGAIALLGQAVPLIGGLRTILGGIKFNGAKPLSAQDLNKLATSKKFWVTKMIGKPVTRIVINGVLGGWMGIMSHFMDKQMRRSTERAVALRGMKESFNSANGLMYCKPEDRNNTEKPKCFCYNSDNKLNPERSKQPACASEYTKLTYDPFGVNNNNDKVCLDQNSNLDTACACRAKRNCMKISSGLNMKGFNPGTFKMISTGMGPAQDLMNGNVGGGDIADSAGINAARIKKAADDMLAKMAPSAAKAVKGYSADLEKGLLANTSGLSMGGSGSNSPLPSSPAAAAAALDKEIKENNQEEAKKAGSRFHGATFNNDEMEFPDFGMGGDTASQELEIAEVMGQEFDMRNSDINTGSTTNLFEVLSNRYKRSGMRRLFDENNPSPVDAPAKKEIVE